MDFNTIMSFFLYLFTFISGVIIDFRIHEDSNHILKKLYIVWLYIFLCFGYMTGSDWRQYERDYTYDYYEWYTYSKEYGSYYVFYLFKHIGVDFWIFTGLFKVLYLHSLFSLASCFTKKKLFVISMYFLLGDLVTMLISCPFRYMIAITIANYAICQYIKQNKIIAISLLLLACTFHSAFIVTVAIILSYFLLNKITCKISNIQYIILYTSLYIIILFTPIFEFIYSTVVPFLNLTNLAEHYEEENNIKDFITIGNIKMIILFLLLIYYKDKIIKLKYGNLLFYFSIFSSFGFLIFKCLPVGSRFNIINNFFFVIVFAQLVYSKRNVLNRTKFIRLALILCFFSTFYNIYSKYEYIPYSNSIPYIISKHIPFNERSEYNYLEYKKRTGKEIVHD